MAGIGTLVDLLLFYTLERVLFNRMVCSLGKNSQQVKKAIALWLVLEEVGHHDLIRTIHSHDDHTVEALFNKALHCLKYVQPNAASPFELDNDHIDSPVFLDLFNEPMNYSFFYYNRGFIYKRYVHFMESVCDKIFREKRAIEVDESGARPVVGTLGEGSSESSSSLVLAGDFEAPKRQSSLNPGANEFHPRQEPVETRTLFLTFSRGFPLSRDPQFGYIVFTTSSVIPKVLNGQPKAKFVVNRKHLWARIFEFSSRRGKMS